MKDKERLKDVWNDGNQLVTDLENINDKESLEKPAFSMSFLLECEAKYFHEGNREPFN